MIIKGVHTHNKKKPHASQRTENKKNYYYEKLFTLKLLVII